MSKARRSFSFVILALMRILMCSSALEMSFSVSFISLLVSVTRVIAVPYGSLLWLRGSSSRIPAGRAGRNGARSFRNSDTSVCVKFMISLNTWLPANSALWVNNQFLSNGFGSTKEIALEFLASFPFWFEIIQKKTGNVRVGVKSAHLWFSKQ